MEVMREEKWGAVSCAASYVGRKRAGKEAAIAISVHPAGREGLQQRTSFDVHLFLRELE